MKAKRLLRNLTRFIRDNKAVSALEYAVLVGVVAVGIGAALITLGDDVEKALKEIGKKVTAVPGKL